LEPLSSSRSDNKVQKKPKIKKNTLNQKAKIDRNLYTTEPKNNESEKEDSKKRRQSLKQKKSRKVQFNRKKKERPSRQKESNEEYGIVNKVKFTGEIKQSKEKDQFVPPDNNSLQLFEPNLMNDDDFNDMKDNCDNKKLKKSIKSMKKSNSMLGKKSNFSMKPQKSQDRLNKSFNMERINMNMKPFATQTKPQNHIIKTDHNEMSFRNKNFQSNLSVMSNISKNTDKAIPKIIKPGPARERNFTLGPMEMNNKLFQQFNAETQSKSGADNVSQKTFLTESNNTVSNIFNHKLAEKGKALSRNLEIMEIKEDARERQDTRDEKVVRSEYGLKEQTSLENIITGTKRKESLDVKIKKNIRNSIKEDSMFGEPFVEFLETNQNAFEVNPDKVFSISDNKNPFAKEGVFKKSKTMKTQNNHESARISFEMTADQLKKKRQEMKKGNKFEIEADKTLGAKSPSNRSISFENQARNKFFVERNNEKNKKLNKSNSMMLDGKSTVKSEVEKEALNQSFNMKEPEFKKKKKKNSNVFMSSVENNLFMRQDKNQDSLDGQNMKENPKNAQSDKKKKVSKNPIIENKSLHSNFKFSSANTKPGKLNMFGKKTGNMAYTSQPKNILKSISSISYQNPTIPSLASNNKIYSEFDLEGFEDKNDSIDLMDEDEEDDFDLNFDLEKSMSKMKSKIVANNLQKNLISGNKNKQKNSLAKQLSAGNQGGKNMMINKDIIDNSTHTKKSNTSHGSNKMYVGTFGKKGMNFGGLDNNKNLKNDNVQNRPKQFTFNNNMVLNSFKNKSSK
jgi:hypothetical protein